MKPEDCRLHCNCMLEFRSGYLVSVCCQCGHIGPKTPDRPRFTSETEKYLREYYPETWKLIEEEEKKR